MKYLKIRPRTIAIAAGTIGLLAAGTGATYWHISQQQWCVRFSSGGGQEVTYSRGCVNPNRYRKWVISA